jgi:Flp pilus assembly protein TadG
MKLPFIKWVDLKDQKGQAIIIGTFFVTALLALGGISVDTAHVFLKKSRLQRTVDAAAMAGIARYDSGVTNAGEVEAQTEQMARYNLLQMNVKESEIQSVTAELTVDANQVAEIALDCRISIPTFFLRLIPGANLDNITVNTVSTSKRNPAVISLVLDVSGSMSCNGGCPSKFQALKDAAHAFVDSFEEGLDQMAVISFSTTATVRQPMAIVNRANLHTVINSLVASGWTNISEGVSAGRIQIESANNPEAVEALLLFTDGAPNHFRAIFTNAKTGAGKPPKNYPPGGPFVWWDYILAIPENPMVVKRPVTLAGVCSGTSSSISNCFNSLAYRDSREVVRPGSGLINMSSETTMLKETYHLAIVEADYGKADGTTFYSIGLGTQATEGADVYQSITNYSNIKSYLLKRIANDPAGVSDPQFPSLPEDPSHPAGIYFQTPDPNDLVELFQAVAKRIRLRLLR